MSLLLLLYVRMANDLCVCLSITKNSEIIKLFIVLQYLDLFYLLIFSVFDFDLVVNDRYVK